MLSEMILYIFERSQDFTTALSQHLSLTFIALGISLFIGLLLGILSTRIRWLGRLVMPLGKLGRTIPSLAVLALALPLLGVGTAPTLVSLVFIGTLPILINTKVGIEQVDKATVEAARGMGLNDRQLLVQVELPIASAIIMAGVRTSAVIIVASATLAAFIGGGGLGDLILRGEALDRDPVMLAGAIPATLLAFYFEALFGRLETWVTPRGLKAKDRVGQTASLSELLSMVALLPLVFGVFLPWSAFLNSEGDAVLSMGVQVQYRFISIPMLVLGLLSVFWPREQSHGLSFIPAGAALLGFLWFVYGIIRTMVLVPLNERWLLNGFYLTCGASAMLALVAVLDLAKCWRYRSSHMCVSLD